MKAQQTARWRHSIKSRSVGNCWKCCLKLFSPRSAQMWMPSEELFKAWRYFWNVHGFSVFLIVLRVSGLSLSVFRVFMEFFWQWRFAELSLEDFIALSLCCVVIVFGLIHSIDVTGCSHREEKISRTLWREKKLTTKVWISCFCIRSMTSMLLMQSRMKIWWMSDLLYKFWFYCFMGVKLLILWGAVQ